MVWNGCPIIVFVFSLHFNASSEYDIDVDSLIAIEHINSVY